MLLTVPLQVRGWLLDVYPSDPGKVAVWIIRENGERIKLTDTFQPCIYVSGKQDDLERLISRLFSNQKIAALRSTQKYAQPTDTEKSRVVEITVMAKYNIQPRQCSANAAPTRPRRFQS
jgi:hypothetical protein